MIENLIISLLLTIIIELTVSILLGIKSTNDIKLVVAVNMCTNPVVVFIANYLLYLNSNTIYNIGVAILEIIAVIVEYILYKLFLQNSKKSPLILSIVNNVISFSTGVIISFLI